MQTVHWLTRLKQLSMWRAQRGHAARRIRSGKLWSASRVQSTQIEVLEDRALLSWVAQGPGPTINAQVTIPANNPVNGAIHSIAAHPTNSDVVFVGTVNGGVWKTTNATTSNTWSPLTDTLQSQSIGAIEFDLTDSTFNTLLAGAGRWSNYASIGDDQGQLYYTTNGGTSWTVFSPAVLNDQKISAVAARGNTWLVTATGGGVYRSTNGGANWANINGLNGLGTGGTQDLAADPSNANRFYLSMTGGGGKLFRTDDAGATWTEVTGAVSGVSGASRVRLAVNASAGAVYVAVGAGGAGAGTKVWRSANQGGDWTQLDDVFVHNGGQQNPNTSLAADPTNANLVYVGGDRITSSPFTGLSNRGDASAASGSQWTVLVNSGATSTAPHADTRDMAFRADGTLLESDDGGMYRHTNPSGTGSWVAAAGNVQAIEAHNVAYNSINNTLVIGTQDNGTHQQSTSGNTQWNFINGGDGGDVAVDSVTLAGSNRSIVYLSSQNLGGFRRVVYDNNNNFVSNTSLASITSPNFTTPIELNSINPQRILIGGASALFESTDQGTTNTDIGGPGQPGFLQNAMVYGGSLSGTPNPELIYVGANSKVYKRTTSGGAITATTALPSGAGQVSDVTIDPDNYDTVFATDNNQVFMSSNGGTNWSDITGNLTSVSSTDFRTIEYVPGNIVDAITIGTRSGVFFALMSAPTVWKKLSNGLPDVLVFDMEYVPSQDLLVAGTFGRAVWTLPNASQQFFNDLSINDVTQAEGDAGTTDWTFTVTLSAATSQTATVQYNISDGGAVAGSDYAAAASGTLSFAPGETSKTITVTVSGDTASESDETFFINLSNASAATIKDGQGVGTIQNDDGLLSINGVTKPEGDSGTTAFTFTVSLQNASTKTVTVDYVTADSTATVGSDYAAIAGTLSFAAGQTSQTITVSVAGDSLIEPNEIFYVNLTSLTNASFAVSQGVGAVLDDDMPALSIIGTTVAEGTENTFTVTLSKPSVLPIRVNFATVSGTAVPGDYLSKKGTLLFGPGETQKTLVIRVLEDTRHEANETFEMTLTGPTNATLANGQDRATCTILDNDAAPTLTISDKTVTEGTSSTPRKMAFKVLLSAVSGLPVTVNYATLGVGTATASDDYTAVPITSLEIAAGKTSATITVDIVGDALDEIDEETFIVELSSPVDATLADAQGTGTIKDNDLPPKVRIGNVTKTEGTGDLIFTLTLSAASNLPVTVYFDTADGAAKSGIDYVGIVGGNYTFNPGAALTTTINVSIINDPALEKTKTFVLNLKNALGAVFAKGIGTILDNV